MRLSCERLDIAYTIVAGAGFEIISKGERAQRCVTTGAAAANHQAIAVHFSALDQIPRAIHAIIYVNHAPVAL